MLLIISTLLLGFLIAKLLPLLQTSSPKHVVKWRSVLQKIGELALLILLFSMGMSLGSNPDLVKALPSLGIKSFVLAMGIVLGSASFTWISVRLWSKRS